MTPKSRRRLIARIAIWSLLIVGGLLLAFEMKATWHVYQKEREAKKSYELEAEAYASLLAREEALSTSVERLGTDRGVEEVVRTRYPLAKPGEEVIVLVDAKSKPKNEQVATSTSFWTSLKTYFGF